jgi:vacuolar iron transporter family protein
MEKNFQPEDLRLGRALVLDELFDLQLFKKLQRVSDPALQKTLSELASVEVGHHRFWQEFFGLHLSELDPARKLKLWFFTLVCRIFGPPAIDLVLEAIEIHGIRKYLRVWERYRNEPLGSALHGILEDEFKHEDEIVSRLKERILNPDRVRNIFLGVNDGMVEILGAVSGFFASLGQTSFVLVAGLTTAVAGALSMAAGAYVAMGSEAEVRKTQEERRQFLGETNGAGLPTESALKSALLVGISYFVGASFPLLPVFFGAQTPLPSILTGGGMILLISAIVAFLSGMNIKKRAFINLILIALAVGITYLIGMAVRSLLGIQV